MNVPSKSPITLVFGATTDPYTPSNPHKGTDFAHIPDDRIYAPFSGKVILRPNNGNDGNGIYMYDGGAFHGLLHSSSYLVTNGQQVSEGQPIAVMGDTGYAFGVHLHWCVKRNGVFIDPMSLIKGEDMSDIADHDFVADACVLGMNLQPETNQVFMNNIGLPKSQVLKNILGYQESRNLRLDAEAYRAGQTTGPAPTVLKPNTLYKTP